MDNKKYLDKVIESLVRGTKIDYNNKLILSNPYNSQIFRFSPLLNPHFLLFRFFSYCKNTFGLTEEEIKYVWDEYKSIILDKIENGE